MDRLIMILDVDQIDSIIENNLMGIKNLLNDLKNLPIYCKKCHGETPRRVLKLIHEVNALIDEYQKDSLTTCQDSGVIFDKSGKLVDIQ